MDEDTSLYKKPSKRTVRMKICELKKAGHSVYANLLLVPPLKLKNCNMRNFSSKENLLFSTEKQISQLQRSL
ncbi:hypothetical protein [Methanosarcina sp.]|uniref:hypothetical protein n=1 Tax=Methanosarcina sp. TaxID=2213 RepID=UPI002D1FAAFF|nr:hypothetical protein [Methanosarcina sp.]